MIRPAELSDIPDLVRLVGELRACAGLPMAVDPSHTAGFLARLIAGGGLCLVVDLGEPVGFVAATVERSSISPEPIATEHGWYCGVSGWGGRLREHFEAWAREQGCRWVRMSTPHGIDRPARALARAGYAPVEVAWAKAVT